MSRSEWVHTPEVPLPFTPPEQRWQLPVPLQPSQDEDLAREMAALGLPPELLAVLRRRGYDSPEAIRELLEPPPAPDPRLHFADLAVAVQRLMRACAEAEAVEAEAVEAEAGGVEGGFELLHVRAEAFDFLGADVVVELAEGFEAVDLGLELLLHRFLGSGDERGEIRLGELARLGQHGGEELVANGGFFEEAGGTAFFELHVLQGIVFPTIGLGVIDDDSNG